MKKQKSPYVLFALSILCMVAVVVLIADMINEYVSLSSRQTEAMDWFLFGMVTAVFGVPCAILGGVSSCLCGIKNSIVWVKVISFIMLFAFVVVLAILLSCFGGANNAVRVAAWLANLFIGG